MRRSGARMCVLATLVASPVLAADCPRLPETAGRLALTDTKGQTSIVEALDSGFVRRTESIPQITAGAKNQIESWQGFFPETVTTITERATTAQYYRISTETHARIRRALPLKVGTSLTIEYEVVQTSGAVAAPVSAAQRWRTVYAVKGEEPIKIGACTYATLIIETSGSNADASLTTATTYAYAPDLKAWLQMRGVFRPAGKPETNVDRTVHSIATLAKE
jgi:hypothetical protein